MPSNLRTSLETFLGPEQILDREIDRVAFASDASFYRLVPRAVLRPRSVADVQSIFAFSRRERIPMTFRSAGTSLSGQAVTDGLLVDVSRYWRTVEPLDGGARVRVQPGVIGGRVNRVLAPFSARIGPDPASIDACMMGGILSNNSSGMCCGVAQNSYRTLESLCFVLTSGTVVDTSLPDAAERLAAAEPAIVTGLASLRDRVRSDSALVERIRKKYSVKNTTGYSINAFVDFDRPVDILRHLIIGSEGTLAFIAEAVLRTVPDLPVKYTGMLLFPTIRDACAAIVPFSEAGAKALEVMDYAALLSVKDVPGAPPAFRSLPDGAAGLLVEFQEPLGSLLDPVAARAADTVAGQPLISPARFSADPAEQALLWKIRKGVIPSVGAVRRRGTTVLLEDVTFPVPRLAEAVVDLQEMFVTHRYDDAIIFGHARDGNLHFLLTQGFTDPAEITRYQRFMDDCVELVVSKYDGSLKAEHGTGRNMAPFVATEWGTEAYEVMKAVKALVDPDGYLNPGVIINPDPKAHVTNLKSLPEVEDEVDRCIECGFCESHCPSRDLTLTPRQRIVVRREMKRSGARGGPLDTAFEYDALDTCATDGLCAQACPVKIDTGQLTKRLRASGHSPAARRIAAWTARHFGVTATAARTSLAVGSLVGGGVMSALSRGARRALGRTVPEWIAPMPPAAPALPATTAPGAAAVYFPSCVTRAIGETDGDEGGLAAAFVRVAARAGLPLVIPDDVRQTCCGQPYSSKGFTEAHAIASNAVVESLWRASREGTIPVVVDTSPCTYSLRHYDGLTPENLDRARRITILDGVEFFAKQVLPKLAIQRKAQAVTLHPVCSLVKMGLTPELTSIARACSDRVFIPPSTGCCGFAGDRGWLLPELTAAATATVAVEVRAMPADGWYSSSRTCEIGMTRATGKTYRSWIHLLDWASGNAR